MLAYAAHRRRIAQRHSAPHLMLLIIAGHVALIAAVMSARMDLPERIRDVTKVELIPIPDDPPPRQPPPRELPKPTESIDRVPTIVPIPRPTPVPLDPPVLLPVPDLRPIGPSPVPQPRIAPMPRDPLRVGPRFATPLGAVRPPYPVSKIQTEEEAVLRLRLSIDPRGRVVAVEPVDGAADPAFLTAARRHLLAQWRYKPATEDGRAIASSTVITLRFELD